MEHNGVEVDSFILALLNHWWCLLSATARSSYCAHFDCGKPWVPPN